MIQSPTKNQNLSQIIQFFPLQQLDYLADLIQQLYIAGFLPRQEFGGLLIRVEQRKAGEVDVTQKLQQIATDIKEVLASQSWQMVMDTESCHPDLITDLPDALHYVRECQWKYSESVGVEYDD